MKDLWISFPVSLGISCIFYKIYSNIQIIIIFLPCFHFLFCNLILKCIWHLGENNVLSVLSYVPRGQWFWGWKVLRAGKGSMEWRAGLNSLADGEDKYMGKGVFIPFLPFCKCLWTHGWHFNFMNTNLFTLGRDHVRECIYFLLQSPLPSGGHSFWHQKNSLSFTSQVTLGQITQGLWVLDSCWVKWG